MKPKPERINKATKLSTNKSKFNSKQKYPITKTPESKTKKYGNFLFWWQEMDCLHQLGLDIRKSIWCHLLVVKQ